MANWEYVNDKELQEFAKAMGLSEQELLDAGGGVKGLTQLRLLRDEARGTMVADGYPGVPRLLSTPEEALKAYKVKDAKLTPKALAKAMLSEQMEKARGIVDGAKADRELKAEQARQKQKEQDDIRREVRGNRQW